MRNRLSNLIDRLRGGARRIAQGARNAIRRVTNRRAASPSSGRTSGS